MNDSVRAALTHLRKVALVFALLSLPSFALRLWHPQPLGGFGQSKYSQIEAVVRRPPAVRMALVGSSKIWTALDAPRISRALYGESDAVANFGVSFWGRGRDFFLAREILKIDSLERLVMGVGYREQNHVQRYFHRLASLSDTVDDPYNRPDTSWSISEARSRVRFWVMESFGNAVAGYGQALYRTAARLRFGRSTPGNFYETGGSLRSTEAMAQPPPPRVHTAYEPDPRERGNRYMARIAELCQARDVELIAVEIPAYGDPRMSSAYRSFLEGIGATVVTCAQPEELFVPENWFDPGHMNVRGAAVMSDRFVEHLWQLDNSPLN
jgi:hypothetical protein